MDALEDKIKELLAQYDPSDILVAVGEEFDTYANAYARRTGDYEQADKWKRLSDALAEFL